MINKIILEYKFTFHQILVLLISVASLILLIITYIVEAFELDDKLLLFGLIVSYPFLIIIAFLKNGFVSTNNRLFKAYFFLGFAVFKSEIDTTHLTRLAVLKFKKNRKLPWFSIARPDIATDFNCFEINILNKSHIKRKIIIELKKQKLVRPALDFLTLNTNLISEPYNPQIRRRPGRKR